MGKARNLEDIRRLAETWGGDPMRWPEDELNAAGELLETDAAREILRAESELDRVLACPPVIDAERGRRAAHAALVKVIEGSKRRSWLGIEFPLWFAPGATIASAAIVGVVLGILVQPPRTNELVGLHVLADNQELSNWVTIR